MTALPLFSQISLYVLLALIGLLALLIGSWQIMVLHGRSMKNPDRTTDDWHEQKTYLLSGVGQFLACLGEHHDYSDQPSIREIEIHPDLVHHISLWGAHLTDLHCVDADPL